MVHCFNLLGESSTPVTMGHELCTVFTYTPLPAAVPDR
jgi:hypothetical protein